MTYRPALPCVRERCAQQANAKGAARSASTMRPRGEPGDGPSGCHSFKSGQRASSNWTAATCQVSGWAVERASVRDIHVRPVDSQYDPDISTRDGA